MTGKIKIRDDWSDKGEEGREIRENEGGYIDREIDRDNGGDKFGVIKQTEEEIVRVKVRGVVQ